MGDGNLKQGDEERDVPRRHGPGGPPRTVIKAAMQYSHEQGLTPRVLTPQEIYAPTLLDS